MSLSIASVLQLAPPFFFVETVYAVYLEPLASVFVPGDVLGRGIVYVPGNLHGKANVFVPGETRSTVRP